MNWRLHRKTTTIEMMMREMRRANKRAKTMASGVKGHVPIKRNIRGRNVPIINGEPTLERILMTMVI